MSTFDAQVSNDFTFNCLDSDVFQLLIEKYDYTIECVLRSLNRKSRRLVNEVTSCRKGVMYILTNKCDGEIKSFTGENWMNFIERAKLKNGSYELKIVDCGGQEVVGERIVFDQICFAINKVTFCNFQTRLEKKFEMFAVNNIYFRNCSYCPVEFNNSYIDECGNNVDIMTRKMVFDKCSIDNHEWFQGLNFWVTVDLIDKRVYTSHFLFVNCLIDLNGFGCLMDFPSFFFNKTIFKGESFYNCFHNSVVYYMSINFDETRHDFDDRDYNGPLPVYNDLFELAGIPAVLPMMRIHKLYVDGWELDTRDRSEISKEMLISIYNIIQFKDYEFHRFVQTSVYERDPVNSRDTIEYLAGLIEAGENPYNDPDVVEIDQNGIPVETVDFMAMLRDLQFADFEASVIDYEPNEEDFEEGDFEEEEQYE